MILYALITFGITASNMFLYDIYSNCTIILLIFPYDFMSMSALKSLLYILRECISIKLKLQSLKKY